MPKAIKAQLQQENSHNPRDTPGAYTQVIRETVLLDHTEHLLYDTKIEILKLKSTKINMSSFSIIFLFTLMDELMQTRCSFILKSIVSMNSIICDMVIGDFGL